MPENPAIPEPAEDVLRSLSAFDDGTIAANPYLVQNRNS